MLINPSKLQTDKTKTIKANMNTGSSLWGKGIPSKFKTSINLFIEFYIFLIRRDRLNI